MSQGEEDSVTHRFAVANVVNFIVMASAHGETWEALFQSRDRKELVWHITQHSKIQCDAPR